jgi:hypothetical protein
MMGSIPALMLLLYGASPEESHSFAYRGSSVSADDVFAFFEKHCHRVPGAGAFSCLPSRLWAKPGPSWPRAIRGCIFRGVCGIM